MDGPPNQYNFPDDARHPMNNFGIDGEVRPTLNRLDSSSDNEGIEGKFSDDEDEKEVIIKQDETDDDDDLPLSKVSYPERS